MYKYTIKRVLLMIPTLIGAAILVFTLLRLIPGDVCMLRLAGEGAFVDQQAIELCRQNTGIADPFIVQFIRFLTGLFTFDFGTSMWTGQPVTHEIALRFKLSLEIAILATVVSVAISIHHWASVAAHSVRVKPLRRILRARASSGGQWVAPSPGSPSGYSNP